MRWSPDPEPQTDPDVDRERLSTILVPDLRDHRRRGRDPRSGFHQGRPSDRGSTSQSSTRPSRPRSAESSVDSGTRSSSVSMTMQLSRYVISAKRQRSSLMSLISCFHPLSSAALTCGDLRDRAARDVLSVTSMLCSFQSAPARYRRRECPRCSVSSRCCQVSEPGPRRTLAAFDQRQRRTLAGCSLSHFDQRVGDRTRSILLSSLPTTPATSLDLRRSASFHWARIVGALLLGLKSGETLCLRSDSADARGRPCQTTSVFSSRPPLYPALRHRHRLCRCTPSEPPSWADHDHAGARSSRRSDPFCCPRSHDQDRR